MSFGHDRRGQSVVVGTVILFGFLILALSVYQVQFVPAENEEIEFEHSQQVEGEFLDLRNAVLQAGSTGSAQSTRIQLGERYPQRTFFLNPPPASGTLQTTGTDTIEVNGQIGDGAHENVQAFWETDPQFNSTSIRYTSNYNEYRGAPQLVYEHSVVAAEFDDAVLFRSDQTVVRNDRISVTALSGEFAENGVRAQSVDPRTISQSVRTVPITGDGGDVEIVLPTAADNTTALRDRWAATLPGATVTEDGDAIRIALDGSETYRLELSAVAVDDGGETEPAYIVPVGSTNATAGESVGVEVRDKYNNPVEGATVVIDDAPNRTTNDDGQVFFNPGSDDSTASINGSVGPDYESVKFNVIGDNRVTLTTVEKGDNKEAVKLTFKKEAAEEITFSEIAFNVYYDGGTVQESFTIQPSGETVQLRAGFSTLSQPLSFDSNTETITLEFDSDVRGALVGITFIDNKNRRTLYITQVPSPGKN